MERGRRRAREPGLVWSDVQPMTGLTDTSKGKGEEKAFIQINVDFRRFPSDFRTAPARPGPGPRARFHRVRVSVWLSAAHSLQSANIVPCFVKIYVGSPEASAVASGVCRSLF